MSKVRLHWWSLAVASLVMAMSMSMGCAGARHASLSSRSPHFACERPEYRNAPPTQSDRVKAAMAVEPPGSALANAPRELASSVE